MVASLNAPLKRCWRTNMEYGKLKVTVLCARCDNMHSEELYHLEDAKLEGWDFVNGAWHCPDCVETGRFYAWLRVELQQETYK